jgi:hypothetical protein
VSFGGDLNEPLAMTFTVPSDFDDYDDDTASDNPLQVRSAVTWVRDGITDFTGRVLNIDIDIDSEAEFERLIRVECVDKLGEIKNCIASLSSDPLGKLKTTTTLRTEQDLLPLVTGSTSYYPDPTDTALWLAISGTPQTVETSTLGIAAGATTITTIGNSSQRMLTKGLLYIGSADEYVAYDGYDSNGTAYVFSNVTRGVLGSSDILHGVAVLKQWVPKRIDPEQAVVIEGKVTPTWIVIDPSLYTVDYENGSIEFETDPTGAYPDGIRGTYYTFDEDDADAIILGGDTTYGAIDLLLQEAKSVGAPGLTVGQLNIDIPRVVLPIVQLSGQNVIDAVAQLLEERVNSGVTKNALEPEQYPIAYWWDSPNDDFVIDQFKANEVVTDIIRDFATFRRNNSVRNSHSGVLVKWTTDLVQNAAFIQVNQTVGSSGFVRNTDVYAKFRGQGFPDVPVIDCGECSEGTARTAGRNFLKKSWTLAYSFEYSMDEMPATLPVRGKLYTMPDGITGRCIGVDYIMEDGAESFTMKIVDLDLEIA